MTKACVKVFSATKFMERNAMGAHITEWLNSEPREIDQVIVKQSSDSEFHCLTIIYFYRTSEE